MGRVEKSIEIRVSPEKVWEMLALDRLPEWMEGLEESVEYTTEVHALEDKYRIGATTHTNIKGAGATDFEITECLENEKITYCMLGKRANNTVVTSILEPFEKGTKFDYVMTYEVPGGIIGKFFGKLAKGTLEKEAEKSLEKLKSILEK